MLLKPKDHAKVKAAIEAAEKRTCGEIYCVVARESSDYWEAPLSFAGGVAVIAPAIVVLSGFVPSFLIDQIGGWTAAHAGAVDAAVRQALTTYVLLQAAVFAAVVGLAWIPPVRRFITPAGLKADRVRRRAHEQFAARALHLTQERTGVLIFASLAEHRAEVIADVGIASKVPPEAWSEVLGALTRGMKARDPGAGFAAAVEKAADLLAPHFPCRPDDRNELPDAVIELERF